MPGLQGCNIGHLTRLSHPQRLFSTELDEMRGLGRIQASRLSSYYPGIHPECLKISEVGATKQSRVVLYTTCASCSPMSLATQEETMCDKINVFCIELYVELISAANYDTAAFQFPPACLASFVNKLSCICTATQSHTPTPPFNLRPLISNSGERCSPKHRALREYIQMCGLVALSTRCSRKVRKDTVISYQQQS